MTEKLSVCFVWHMHQPLYKDRLKGLYLMPWVRLHAIKDYLDMAVRLETIPTLRQTFNLSPCLLEQLEDYALHGAVDEQLLLTTKENAAFTDADKSRILSESFNANLEQQIKPHRPFYELFKKRQRLLKHGQDISAILSEFTTQEYADMTAWMNLCWFDPLWLRGNLALKQLIEQGGNFTDKQRLSIIEIERELMARVIPLYKRLQDNGQIEVMAGPYYHPILPLLIDSNTARYPSPGTPLPQQLYFHAADAGKQLDRGLSLYKRLFGTEPHGLWLPEMAVSPSALELTAASGIDWVILDEAILSRTTGVPIARDKKGLPADARVLCQPYKLAVGDQEISIFFRDALLSNQIGFSYARLDPGDAARSLYERLKDIQRQLHNWAREGVLVIALDGENCWETYEQDGNEFLSELYKRLSTDSTLNITSVSQYLQDHPPTERLHNIHCGSWINADYHIWIGDPVKNHAWDLLSTTRQFLVDHLKTTGVPGETAARAWEEIYAAEGSDWFWWFGQPNNSAQDALFDEQFRLHLRNVYTILSQPVPESLERAVSGMPPQRARRTESISAAVIHHSYD